MVLFGQRINASQVSNYIEARVFSFKLWHNNKLARYLIPAADSNNIAGLYDLVTGTFYTSNTSTALVAGTWEAISYIKIAEQEFTVNTTSTSAASTGTISGIAAAWTANQILYIKVRDKAGKRNGYFLGSDTWFFNRQIPNGGTTTINNAARVTHKVSSEGAYEFSINGGTAGYGVYAYSVASNGNIVIQQRYNSTNSLTINGTYVVEVYLLDYVPPTGNPYDYTYAA